MSKRTLHSTRLATGRLAHSLAESGKRLAARWHDWWRVELARQRQLASLLTARKSPKEWASETFNIRARLALWCATLMAVILLLLGFITYTIAESQLESSVRLTIKSRAEAIASALMREQSISQSVLPTPVPTSPAATQGPVTTPPPASTPDPDSQAKIQQQLSVHVPDVLGRLDLGFEVLDNKGDLKYIAATLGGASLPLDPSAVNSVLRGGLPTYYTAPIPATHSNPASVLSIYVQPLVADRSASPKGPPTRQVVGVVLVAKSLDDAIQSLATLREILLLGDIVAIAMASLGGWFIAERGLHPVMTVTRTAHEIAAKADVDSGALNTRVPYNGPPDEIGELVTTFNNMLAALDRVTKAQQRFVQDASHELRAPLTSIKGNLELLRRRADIPEAERAEMLGDAEAEAARLATLVSDLLLLARLDAAGSGYGPNERWLDEQLRGRRELVPLDEVVMSVFRQSRAQLPARHKDLRLSVRDLQPVLVRADPGQVRQLVLILVDNAIKYTCNGGAVRLSLTEGADGWAELSVADTGIGIASGDLPHIFERFYRADQARVRDEQGSGLGLAIAKWLVAAHGGTIDVTSTPGQGSTFTVRLKTEPPPPRKSLPPASTVISSLSDRPEVKAVPTSPRAETSLSVQPVQPLARLATATVTPLRTSAALRSVRAMSLARRSRDRNHSADKADGQTRSGRSPARQLGPKTPTARPRRPSV